MSDLFVSVTIQIRLTASHGFNEPGFQSSSSGTFSTPIEDAPHYVETVSHNSITVLGLELVTFSIAAPTNREPHGWQSMTINFREPQTDKAIQTFLSNLAIAITASLAPSQRDPWYGNLFVDIDWFSIHLNPLSSGAGNIDVSARMQMTAKHHQTLPVETLEGLTVSGLTEIFVDGMRSNQPKSKYSNWFIPLEELEQLATTDFKTLFTPLFPSTSRAGVAKASGLTGTHLERLKGFLGNPNHTVQGRSEKLFEILKSLELLEIPTIKEEKITLDLKYCNRLIQGRNSLAHKGTKVDEDLLYNVLFPLSFRVLNYLITR